MPENKKKTRGNLAVMGRLVGLVKPLTPVMVAAVLLGVAGFLCAIFITVLGAYALLDSILPGMPISLGTVFLAVWLFFQFFQFCFIAVDCCNKVFILCL